MATKKPLLGAHPASAPVRVAIRELLKVKAEQAILAKKSKLLRGIIAQNGGGSALGYRSYVSHHAATCRWVRSKACDTVTLVKVPT